MSGTYSTTATATSPVGDYAIVPAADATAAVLANYNVALVNGKLTVTKAALTMTPNSATRVLGAANPTLSATLSGFVNGELESELRTANKLSGDAACSTAATASSPVGAYDITCTANTLTAANYAFPASVTGTGKLAVIYNYSGFFQPIDNKDPVSGKYILNTAKAGSTIPVKFSLAGDQGLDIWAKTATGAAIPPASAAITCDAQAPADNVEELSTATTSGLKYDAVANQYIYNWKTASAMAGSCQQLIVKLADGTVQRANFKLTK